MRKIISVIVLVVILAVVGFGVFNFLGKKDVSIESILPEDPIVFVHLKDTSQNLKELTSTEIWQTISRLDYEKLLESSKISEVQRQYIDMILAQVTDPTNSMIINKLFGQEVGIAVYETNLQTSQLQFDSPDAVYGVFEDLLSSVFIVTRVPKDVQVAEVFTRTFSSFGKNITSKTENYKGLKIHVLTDQKTGISFSFARVNDLLVLGAGVQAAQKVWDVVKKDIKPLLNDREIKESLQRSVAAPDVSVFWDMKKILETMKTSSDMAMALSRKKDENIQQQADEFFDKMSGFESLGISAKIDKLMSMKFDMFFNRELMDIDLALFYESCISQKNASLKIVPQNVLAYQWTSCFGLDYYWNEIQKELKKIESAENDPYEKLRKFERDTGLNIESDILAALGDEIGGYLADIKTGGLFPIPKALLFIEIEDEDKAQKLLNKLSEIPLVTFNEEKYEGIPLTFLAISLGGDFQPTYSFVDKYLLIGINKGIVKDSIDVFRNKTQSITSNQDFKEIDFGLSGKNSSVYFVRMGAVTEKMNNILEWSNKWIGAKQKRQQAFQRGSERRLEDIIAKIAEAREELQQKKDRVSALENEIEELFGQGLDVRGKKLELENTKTEIIQLNIDIESGIEQKVKLEEIVDGYKETFPDAEKRQLVLDEVVYPLLESFQSIRSLGSKMHFEDDAFETSIFMQLY